MCQNFTFMFSHFFYINFIFLLNSQPTQPVKSFILVTGQLRSASGIRPERRQILETQNQENGQSDLQFLLGLVSPEFHIAQT